MRIPRVDYFRVVPKGISNRSQTQIVPSVVQPTHQNRERIIALAWRDGVPIYCGAQSANVDNRTRIDPHSPLISRE